MRPARGRRFSRCLLLSSVLLLALGLAFGNVQADTYDERRVRSAARLMRALLAADEGLGGHDPAGHARVLVIADSEHQAALLVSLIAPADAGEKTTVSGHPLDVSVRLTLPDPEAGSADAVFLAQPLPEPAFRALLDWCVERQVILYSPFEGDVERGATAGLSIQAKVQPFVNSETLKASGISLRPFFLEHSRVWP